MRARPSSREAKLYRPTFALPLPHLLHLERLSGDRHRTVALLRLSGVRRHGVVHGSVSAAAGSTGDRDPRGVARGGPGTSGTRRDRDTSRAGCGSEAGTRRVDRIRADRAGDDFVNGPAEPHDVELARLVFAEGGDVQRGIQEEALAAAFPPADLSAAVVAVDVRTGGERALR